MSRVLSDPAQRAQLALLLEVASAPKPGNVDRCRDLPGLTIEHFLAGSLGAGPGLQRAATGGPVGEAFERAVAGMAEGAGTNTAVGALLLLVPLVRAADNGIDKGRVQNTLDETTLADARSFYRAFDAVDVAVSDPPAEYDDLDVRRGSEAIPAVESAGMTLAEILALGPETDDVAREWRTGFERSFGAATVIETTDGPLSDRIATAYLTLLARRPDSLVATRHGTETASRVMERASGLLSAGGITENRDAVHSFAEDLVDREINPGTTADLVAAGVFIGLENGTVTL